MFGKQKTVTKLYKRFSYTMYLKNKHTVMNEFEDFSGETNSSQGFPIMTTQLRFWLKFMNPLLS